MGNQAIDPINPPPLKKGAIYPITPFFGIWGGGYSGVWCIQNCLPHSSTHEASAKYQTCKQNLIWSSIDILPASTFITFAKKILGNHLHPIRKKRIFCFDNKDVATRIEGIEHWEREDSNRILLWKICQKYNWRWQWRGPWGQSQWVFFVGKKSFANRGSVSQNLHRWSDWGGNIPYT